MGFFTYAAPALPARIRRPLSPGPPGRKRADAVYERGNSLVDISYFREFVTLAEAMSYRKAGDLLYISQPTLTQHIKKLEDELGVRLIERSTRRLSLTDCGKAFLTYAVRIANIQDEYTEDLNSRKNIPSKNTIVVGSAIHLPEALIQFAKLHPELKITILPGKSLGRSSEYFKMMLRQKQCQIVLLREIEGAEDENYARVTCTRDELILAMPANHPLRRCGAVVPVEKLKNEKFVTFDETSQVFRVISDLCQSRGFLPKVAYQVQRNDDIFHMVRSGLGVALVTRSSFSSQEYLEQREVVYVRTDPSAFLNINALFLKEQEVSGGLQLLLDYLSGKDAAPQPEKSE